MYSPTAPIKALKRRTARNITVRYRWQRQHDAIEAFSALTGRGGWTT
jgi:hypothetical protein